MNMFGKSQTPVQPEAQEPPELTRISVQTGLPPEALPPDAARAPEAAPAPAEKPLPRAKPGFRGIWADAEKCDTSDWNVYYFYYREIAQQGRKKFQRMKWIALAANFLFFLIVGVLLYLNFKASRIQDFEMALDYIVSKSLPTIMLCILIALFSFLALGPAVMVNQAFKTRERRHGFLTSRAKEQPLLLHLMEYTSCKGLVTGLVQSLVYTYVKLLLYMSPMLLAIAGAFVFLAFRFSWLQRPDIPQYGLIALVILMGLTAAVSFISLQSFCFRLDTLCFAGVLASEIISFLISLSGPDAGYGRNIFALIAMWAACMVYYPLAAADTLEFGIGKHARRIRFFLLGVIAFNFLWFVFWGTNLNLPHDKSYATAHLSEKAFMAALLPCQWMLAGLFGLVETSLSAASYRAKNVFKIHAGQAKNNVFSVRFFDPASPASVIPVIALEIAIVGFFIFFAMKSNVLDFTKESYDVGPGAITLYIGLMVLAAAHFALIFLTFSRRHSHKERKPWQTHPNFNGLFFLIFAIFVIVWMMSGGLLVVPLFTYVMAVMAVFIIWEPINAPDEARPAEPPPADFGRDQR